MSPFLSSPFLTFLFVKGKRYLELCRLHRPIGIWLMFWPSVWGLALATGGKINLKDVLLLLIGATFIRSAGCVYNDWVDRDFDAYVRRTLSRPLASGVVSSKEATALFGFLLLTSFGILLCLPLSSILFGIVSVPFILIYPWLKRITFWPQAFLGLTINWGLWIGYFIQGHFWTPALILFFMGGIFWTIGYDTMYAHQDREDDLRLGIKSTALLFSHTPKRFICSVYSLAWGFFLAAGYMHRASIGYFFCLTLVGLIFCWQALHMEKAHPETCAEAFQANQSVGALILLGLLL